MAGVAKSGSVTVVGAGAVEHMDVPGAGPVTVPVGEKARPGNGPPVTGGVVPVVAGKMPVTEIAVTVAMRAMPVAVTVDVVRAAVMTVGARMEPMGVEVKGVGVPVMSVRVPRMVVRPGRRRGVGMGDREERHERPEREPRGGIAAAVPAMMPPARLGGTGDREHGRENECGTSHRASSWAGSRRTPRMGGTARIPIASGSPAL